MIKTNTIYHLHVDSFKNDTNELVRKTNRPTDIILFLENKIMVSSKGEREGEGIN